MVTVDTWFQVCYIGVRFGALSCVIEYSLATVGCSLCEGFLLPTCNENAHMAEPAIALVDVENTE